MKKLFFRRDRYINPASLLYEKNVRDIFVQAVKKFITNFSKKSYMCFLELTSYGSNVNNKKRKYTVLVLC